MQGKIDEAVVELQKEAKMGAPRAMYLIGCCLREGYGHVEADERKAVKWFQKGYEEGSALCGISLVNGTDDQEMWDIVNECFPRVLKAPFPATSLRWMKQGISIWALSSSISKKA